MKLSTMGSLELSTISDIIMLAPPSKGTQPDDEYGRTSSTSENTLLHGAATLSLRKGRTVKEILVELVARQSVIVDGFRHTYGIRTGSVVIPVQAKHLEAGVHHFPFELVIPSSAAPSEQTPYGRTVQNLIATVKGFGRMKRSLTASKALTVVSQHSNGLPPGFNLDTIASSAYLGAVVANLSSAYLTVAGSVDLNLEVREVLQAVRIDDVRVEIHQNYESKALDERWNTVTQAKDIIHVWSAMDEREPTVCSPGSSFSIRGRMRLPKEEEMRASTPKTTVTGIRVTHKLVIVVTYSPLRDAPKKQRKEFCIGMPAVFSSCHAMVAGNQLPAYVKEEDVVAAPGYSKPPCLCEMSDPDRDDFLSSFTHTPDADEDHDAGILERMDVLTLAARKRRESGASNVSTSSTTVEVR